MKTHPSQRHFAVPVAIVASAHVIFFLGFSKPQPIKPLDLGKPKIERVEIPVDLAEPPKPIEESLDDVVSKPTKGGPSAPETTDSPQFDNHTGILVPIERSSIQPVNGPIATIPIHPGEGGVSDGIKIATVHDLDFTPRTVSQLAPLYPASLRSAGISGTVIVAFVVDIAGRVTDAHVVSASHPDFAEPALRAVSRWKFEPGKHHGRPVSFRMSVPLNFVLGD